MSVYIWNRNRFEQMKCYFLFQKASALAVIAWFVFCLSIPDTAWSSEKSATYPPQRIVSLNVCTDQLLMLIAKPENIQSLSYLARDPAYSAMAKQAQNFPVTYGRAEEILKLKPDLTVTMAFSGSSTTKILKKLGFRVISVPYARSFSDVRNNIRLLGSQLGRKKRAEQILKEFDHRLANIPKADENNRPFAIAYYVNHYAAGKNTVMNEILTHAGFETSGNIFNISGMHKLSLETLIRHAPDFIFTGYYHNSGKSMGNQLLTHPAIKKTAHKKTVIPLAHNLTDCGTPHILTALEKLSKIRKQLLKK